MDSLMRGLLNHGNLIRVEAVGGAGRSAAALACFSVPLTAGIDINLV